MSDTPHQPEKSELQVDHLRTFLAIVENSIGSRTFQNLYARIGDNPESEDVMYGGERSCAFFASGLLAIVGRIDRAHATVASLRRIVDEDPQWQQIEKPQPGCLIFWELAPDSGGVLYKHCGFYLRENVAISTNELSRVPIAHHLTFGTLPDGSPKRPIEAMYMHPEIS